MAKYTTSAPTKAKAIAKRAGTTAAEIRRLNDLTKGQQIQAGTQLRLGRGFSIPGTPTTDETPVAKTFDSGAALNDPMYQYYMNEAMGGFRGDSARERERLSNMFTDIYGETGALKNFDTQATQDQRRLAGEMASRGTLRSGAYAGGERGLGTLQQKEQASQRAGIERSYSNETSPQALFDMGLARGADNKVRELVQGEDVSWVDPSSGQTKTMKYDWTQTTAGRQAKQMALQQWMQKQLAGITSVM